MNGRQNGMTLIELVVVMVIIGILASIAVPSYRQYVIRANRTEARAALLALATAQEKYYLQFNCYADTIDSSIASNAAPTDPSTCTGGKVVFPETSERGYYNISVTAADASGWAAESVPNGSPQSSDTKCQSLALTSSGVKTANDSSDHEVVAECWGK